MIFLQDICNATSWVSPNYGIAKRNIPNWYEIEWNDVLKIREVYKPWSDERLVLDAKENLQSNIDKAIEYVYHQSI